MSQREGDGAGTLSLMKDPRRGARPRGYGSAEGEGLWKESVKAHPDTVPLLGRLTGVLPSALSDLKKISGRLFLSCGSRL